MSPRPPLPPRAVATLACPGCTAGLSAVDGDAGLRCPDGDAFDRARHLRTGALAAGVARLPARVGVTVSVDVSTYTVAPG